MTLIDPHGRRFSYLRLSITDACNFRCAYCLPDGYSPAPNAPGFLSLSEILNLGRAFAELGTWKIRLTGGEPTLRRDLVEIAGALSEIPGVRKLALSTNGHQLERLAPGLRAAGVRAVNISVDSLDPARFAEITGMDRLPEILRGVDAAIEHFETVKLNAVLLKGWNDGELERFLEFARRRPVGVRFIELMPTASTSKLFEQRHVRADTIRARLLELGWAAQERADGAGPAEELAHPDYAGRVGLIAPYARDFCASCNRLRVTSRGELRLCLFGEGNLPLRPWLQHESQKEELKARLRSLLGQKEVSHYLNEGRYGNNASFSAMGG
jgi:cyclic pyranopterin phosphate synthase